MKQIKSGNAHKCFYGVFHPNWDAISPFIQLLFPMQMGVEKALYICQTYPSPFWKKVQYVVIGQIGFN